MRRVLYWWAIEVHTELVAEDREFTSLPRLNCLARPFDGREFDECKVPRGTISVVVCFSSVQRMEDTARTRTDNDLRDLVKLPKCFS